MFALKLLHLLCFVYWLGGDLGTFYASMFVARRELTPAARITAAKIMMGADLAPRVCMPLTLASGVNLAIVSGHLPWPSHVAVVTWLACGAWLAMVLTLHHVTDRARTAWLTRVDFGWRVLLVAALGALAAAALGGTTPTLAPWLGLKLACFAATVFCGLMIRLRIRPFGPAFARLATQGPDEAANRDIASSLGQARPYVVGIWGLMLVAAATGIHWITP